MPGGDRATRYPSRIAVGIIAERMGDYYAVKYAEKLGLYKGLPYGNEELKVILSQLSRSPRASSIGRFLDAVSALLGVCYERTYEGEPAMKLEDYALGGRILDNLDIEIEERKGRHIILTGDLLLDLLEKIGREDRRSLAFTVQYRLGYALGIIAKDLLKDYNAEKIIVSGGAAVNEIIMKGVCDGVGLRKLVVRPQSLPPGDGGLSTGQAAIANMLRTF